MSPFWRREVFTLFTKYQCHCPLYDPNATAWRTLCLAKILDWVKQKSLKYTHVELKSIVIQENKFPHLKIISAALIRGRRSLRKFDLKCGAHSRAALKRVNTVYQQKRHKSSHFARISLGYLISKRPNELLCPLFNPFRDYNRQINKDGKRTTKGFLSEAITFAIILCPAKLLAKHLGLALQAMKYVGRNPYSE